MAVFYTLLLTGIILVGFLGYITYIKNTKETSIAPVTIQKTEPIYEPKPITKPIIEPKPKSIPTPVNKDVEYDISFEIQDSKPIKYTQQKKPIEKVQKPKNQPNNEIKFSLSTKKIDNIENLLDLYGKNKTYPLAIKISKHFYDEGDYQNSLVWSKKANKLNPQSDESWIMYAKSEYALGNENGAKNMLSMYIKNSNSEKAKKLLQYWLTKE
jgi:hypothetical protein